jgi:hypothetical protein
MALLQPVKDVQQEFIAAAECSVMLYASQGFFPSHAVDPTCRFPDNHSVATYSGVTTTTMRTCTENTNAA